MCASAGDLASAVRRLRPQLGAVRPGRGRRQQDFCGLHLQRVRPYSLVTRQRHCTCASCMHASWHANAQPTLHLCHASAILSDAWEHLLPVQAEAGGDAGVPAERARDGPVHQRARPAVLLRQQPQRQPGREGRLPLPPVWRPRPGGAGEGLLPALHGCCLPLSELWPGIGGLPVRGVHAAPDVMKRFPISDDICTERSQPWGPGRCGRTTCTSRASRRASCARASSTGASGTCASTTPRSPERPACMHARWQCMLQQCAGLAIQDGVDHSPQVVPLICICTALTEPRCRAKICRFLTCKLW